MVLHFPEWKGSRRPTQSARAGVRSAGRAIIKNKQIISTFVWRAAPHHRRRPPNPYPNTPLWMCDCEREHNVWARVGKMNGTLWFSFHAGFALIDWCLCINRKGATVARHPHQSRNRPTVILHRSRNSIQTSYSTQWQLFDVPSSQLESGYCKWNGIIIIVDHGKLDG